MIAGGLLGHNNNGRNHRADYDGSSHGDLWRCEGGIPDGGVLVVSFLTHPVIASLSEVLKYRRDVDRGVSTHDVHIVADYWNNKHLMVVCEYPVHWYGIRLLGAQPHI